jgi:hypothetical protein
MEHIEVGANGLPTLLVIPRLAAFPDQAQQAPLLSAADTGAVASFVAGGQVGGIRCSKGWLSPVKDNFSP